MALNLSIKQFVLVSLASLALFFGIIYLVHIQTSSTEIIDSIQYPAAKINENIRVTITPQESQEGTVFSIIAQTPNSETQDLYLTLEGESTLETLNLYDDGQHFDGEANDGVFGGLLPTDDFALGSYQIKSEDQELATFTIQEPGCEAILGNPNPSKLNVLIVPDNYDDFNEFKSDALNLISGEETLTEIEPFKSNLNAFSFSIVNSQRDLECERGCLGIERAVCCNDQVVSEVASRCHNDAVIVLVKSTEECGTASSYAKVCSGSDDVGLILTHEFGHSFGGLADEYVYSNSFDDYELPEDYILSHPNCAQQGCGKWSDVTDDCYEGCTSPSLFRSSRNSIMRYISSGEFNEVSQQHITETIQSSLQAEQTQTSELTNWNSYYVTVHYNNGEVQLSPISLKPVKSSAIESSNSKLYVRTISSNGKVLTEQPIPLPLIEFPAYEISDKPLVKTNAYIPLLIPFNPQATTLQIVRAEQDEPLAETSLEAFSNKCGNSICDDSENHLSCSIDCTIENDNFCQSNICDPDCPNQENCTNNHKTTWPIFLIIVGAIVILVTLIRTKRD